MDWNQITQLPLFWEPFHSLTFTIIAIFVVPAIFAYIIGAAMFKRRVGGVYFSIITQAIASILTILIVGQQGYTGGINGITDLKTIHGWNINSSSAKYILYYFNGALLIGVIMVCRYVLSSKLGRLLLAMRDKEDRVRFSGYDVSNFKIFTFCLGPSPAGHHCQRNGRLRASGEPQLCWRDRVQRPALANRRSWTRRRTCGFPG